MRQFLIAILLFTIILPANAEIISADADGYSDNTNICTAFSGMTLSSVGSYTGLDGQVYAHTDGLASTGASVFANNLSFQRQWSAHTDDSLRFALQADFDQSAQSVSIDIIGNDYSGSIGTLYAYNSSHVLLDSITSDSLDYGEVYKATIERSGFEVAYIIAGGYSGDTVHLDNLTATVPEPATFALFSLGGLLLTKKRKLLH